MDAITITMLSGAFTLHAAPRSNWQVMIEVESRKQRIAIDAEQSERLEQAGMLERCECVCPREALCGGEAALGCWRPAA